MRRRTTVMAAATVGSAAVLVGSLSAMGAAAAPARGAAGAAAVPVSATVTTPGMSFSPRAVQVAVGGKVTWKISGLAHTVTDSSSLHLFDKALTPGGSFTYQFTSAGTYAYHCRFHFGMTGTVGVPVKLTPTSATVTQLVNVRWAQPEVPSGFAETVQLQKPGSTAWTSFAFKVPVHDASFQASLYGSKKGAYKFRARLEKGAAHSDWSPVATVTVH